MLRWVALSILFLLLSAGFLGDLRHQDWSYDDEDYIRSARHTQNDFPYLFLPDKEGLEGQYNAARPTVHLYFYLLYPLLGESPGAWHLANVLLHTAVALLLSILIHRWCGRFFVASLAGLLFLQAISHFRVIYWVAGVGMLLGTLLGIGSVLAMLAYLRGRRSVYWWLSLALFLFAPFAHESVVMFAGLLAWATVSSERIRRGVLLVLPHTAIIAATWLLSRVVYNTPLSRESDYHLGLHIVKNLPLMVFNLFAAGYYDIRWTPIPVAAKIASGTAVLLLLLFLARRFRSLIPVLLWLLLSTLPYLPFVDAAFAWRYHYLPATATSLLLAVGLVRLGRWSAGWLRFPAGRFVVPLVLALVLVASASRHTGFLKAVQHSFSGMYLLRHDQYERALVQFEWADAKAGDHPVAYRWKLNKAITLISLQRFDEAYPVLVRLAARYPSYENTYDVLLQLFMMRHEIGDSRPGERGRSDVDPVRVGRVLKSETLHAARAGRWEEAKGLSTLFLHFFPPDGDVEAVLREAHRILAEGDSAAR